MNAVILCVGQLKEPWQKDGVQEYLKRLSRYGKYEVVQVPDAPDGKSDALIRQGMEKEGEQLLKAIRPGDHVVCLCVKAKAPTSEGLAEQMRAWAMSGKRIVFVIGGSNGLSEAVLRRADEKLSFSNLTFPHGLMRVILLEQLYRGEKICAGEKYHK